MVEPPRHSLFQDFVEPQHVCTDLLSPSLLWSNVHSAAPTELASNVRFVELVPAKPTGSPATFASPHCTPCKYFCNQATERVSSSRWCSRFTKPCPSSG